MADSSSLGSQLKWHLLGSLLVTCVIFFFTYVRPIPKVKDLSCSWRADHRPCLRLQDGNEQQEEMGSMWTPVFREAVNRSNWFFKEQSRTFNTQSSVTLAHSSTPWQRHYGLGIILGSMASEANTEALPGELCAFNAFLSA